MKKPPLGSLIAASDPSSGGPHVTGHPGHAFSHYSQMGMHVKSHMMGGAAGVTGGMTGSGGPGGGGVPGATRAPTMTDWFGKMMSFSTCQSPVLPSYYQNSMYSTEKIDSHL